MAHQKHNPLWAKASQIFQLTIFSDKEALRRAKKNGQIVQYKDNDRHIWYDLNSVAPEFKKQKTA